MREKARGRSPRRLRPRSRRLPPLRRWRRAGLRSAKTRAFAAARFDALSIRRGKLPLTSIAASAALSSARADCTGSTIPAGTAVLGSGLVISEFVIAGFLHESDVLAHRLGGVLPSEHLAELQDAEQREQQHGEDQDSEHCQRGEPDRPPRRQPRRFRRPGSPARPRTGRRARRGTRRSRFRHPSPSSRSRSWPR